MTKDKRVIQHQVDQIPGDRCHGDHTGALNAKEEIAHRLADHHRHAAKDQNLRIRSFKFGSACGVAHHGEQCGQAESKRNQQHRPCQYAEP